MYIICNFSRSFLFLTLVLLYCPYLSVGLLLDLNEGTLAVYKNRQRLGIIKDGLSGEYCWLMSIQGASNSNAVQIKKGFFPDIIHDCIN